MNFLQKQSFRFLRTGLLALCLLAACWSCSKSKLDNPLDPHEGAIILLPKACRFGATGFNDCAIK